MLMFQSHFLTNFDADVTMPKRDEEPGTNKSFSLTHFPKDMKNTQMKVSCVLFSRHLFICSLIFSDLQMTATQNQKAAASLQVRKAKEDFPLRNIKRLLTLGVDIVDKNQDKWQPTAHKGRWKRGYKRGKPSGSAEGEEVATVKHKLKNFRADRPNSRTLQSFSPH